jgi:hypothetical protein
MVHHGRYPPAAGETRFVAYQSQLSHPYRTPAVKLDQERSIFFLNAPEKSADSVITLPPTG